MFTYPLMEIIGKSEGAKTAKYYDNYVNDKLTLYYEKKAEQLIPGDRGICHKKNGLYQH